MDYSNKEAIYLVDRRAGMSFSDGASIYQTKVEAAINAYPECVYQ